MTKSKRGAHVPKNASNIRKRYKADGKTVRSFEVRYRDPVKRDSRGYPAVRGKAFKTEAEAREWQHRISLEILDGDYVHAEQLKTKWREVADEWLEVRRVKLRARTMSGYENVLNKWLSEWDDKPIGSITTRDVRAIMRKVRAAGRAVGTEHDVYDTLNGVLKFAVRDGYIKKNPALTVREDLRGGAEKDYVGQALTLEQAEAIIAELPEGRFRTYGLMGLWTGMRAGEVAGLRVRNIDFDKLTIQVMETVEDIKGSLQPGVPKTRRSKGRYIPVPKGVLDEVAAFIEGEGLKQDDYVFAVPGKLFNHANFYERQWRPACKRAGLEGIRFHTLRHTFITLRAREGVPDYLLGAWAGHSNPNTTAIYTHVFRDDPRNHDVGELIYSTQRREVPKAELRLVESDAS